MLRQTIPLDPSTPLRRAAVPVFRGRVSPVLDNCTQLRILEWDGKDATDSPAIPVKNTSLFDRAYEIQKLGIGLIICGAVSDSFYNLLKQSGIDLVCGITGDINEVIDAYRKGMLEQPRFRMPGF